MKKLLLFILAGALSAALLAACGGAASAPSMQAPASGDSSQQESQPQQEETTAKIYRGRVEEVTEDTITVVQMEGYNYGQPSIIFHIDEQTQMPAEAPALAVDAFVQVTYDGILTRSLPAQGAADEIVVISSFSEGVLVNGTIQEVKKTDTGYVLAVEPFPSTGGEEEGSSLASSAPESTSWETPSGAVPPTDFQNLIMITVPEDALEDITADELVEGAKVCVVTNGIAALSMPPQMGAVALLPYTV